MTRVRTGRVFRYGPDDCLIGSITTGAQTHSRIGIVLWGMGLAEMQAARLFARQGFVSLQTRLEKHKKIHVDELRRIYDNSGVDRVRDAMNKLGAEHGVDQFVLMGNCAHANLCFNTALHDSRVSGLILTNPHFSGVQTFSLSMGRKALRPRSWRRLLTGQINLRWLRAAVLRKLRLADEESLVAQWDYQKDLVLPANFSEKLRILTDRGVNSLIVYAYTERSLTYLRTEYGKTLNALEVAGKVRVEVIQRDSHIFSKDNVAVDLLNEAIEKWARQTLPALSTGQPLAESAVHAITA